MPKGGEELAISIVIHHFYLDFVMVYDNDLE
jgi:hypothetical protein